MFFLGKSTNHTYLSQECGNVIQTYTSEEEKQLYTIENS